MAEQYHGMAIGIFELDSECACFVALDAAAKGSSSTDSGSGEKPSGSRCLCKDAGKYFGCESCDGSGDPDGRANRKVFHTR